jgi:sugar phosphate isomerase/epimerase
VPLGDALKSILPRLAEIHLHDSPMFLKTGQLGYGKDHQPLGSGDLDLPWLLDQLSQARFTGPIIFELKVEEALASLEVIRSVRPGVLLPYG